MIRFDQRAGRLRVLKTDSTERRLVRERRALLKKLRKCINGPLVGSVGKSRGVEHGPVVGDSGKCQRCLDVHGRTAARRTT